MAGISARIEVKDKAEASSPMESLFTRFKKYLYSSFTCFLPYCKD